MAKPTTPEKTDDKEDIKKDENENIGDKAEEKQEKGTPFIKQSSFPSESLDVFAQAKKKLCMFLRRPHVTFSPPPPYQTFYYNSSNLFEFHPHITNCQFNWDGTCLVYSLVGWLVSAA